LDGNTKMDTKIKKFESINLRGRRTKTTAGRVTTLTLRSPEKDTTKREDKKG